MKRRNVKRSLRSWLGHFGVHEEVANIGLASRRFYLYWIRSWRPAQAIRQIFPAIGSLFLEKVWLGNEFRNVKRAAFFSFSFLSRWALRHCFNFHAGKHGRRTWASKTRKRASFLLCAVIRAMYNWTNDAFIQTIFYVFVAIVSNPDRLKSLHSILEVSLLSFFSRHKRSMVRKWERIVKEWTVSKRRGAWRSLKFLGWRRSEVNGA